jgi:hypothetical protein
VVTHFSVLHSRHTEENTMAVSDTPPQSNAEKQDPPVSVPAEISNDEGLGVGTNAEDTFPPPPDGGLEAGYKLLGVGLWFSTPGVQHTFFLNSFLTQLEIQN